MSEGGICLGLTLSKSLHWHGFSLPDVAVLYGVQSCLRPRFDTAVCCWFDTRVVAGANRSIVG